VSGAGGDRDGDETDARGRAPGDGHLGAVGEPAFADTVRDQVVGQGVGAGQGDAGDRGEQGEEDRGRHGGEQQRLDGVRVGAHDGLADHEERGLALRVARGEFLVSDEGGGAEADHGEEQAGDDDDGHGPGHRAPHGLRVAGGEHAHGDVGQYRGAEYDGQLGADHVEFVAGELQSGSEVRVSEPAARLGGVDQRGRAEVEAVEDQYGDGGGRAEQYDGLDDLDEGGALHAADRRVRDHQQSEEDDRAGLEPVGVEAEDDGEQVARAGQLEDHQRQQRGQGDGRGGDPYGGPVGPAAEDVTHGEPARVAQGFGEQEHHQDQRQHGAQGERQPVVAEERDDADGAEDGSGGDVVARDGEAALHGGQGAVTGVELAEVVPVGPCHHAQQQRHGDDGDERHEGHGLCL
jgi:hypothetical protein